MDDKTKAFLKEWSMHLQALSIIILLIVVWLTYANSINIQKEIALNCGWEEGDDVQCYCEKSKAMEIKNKMETPIMPYSLNISGLENVEVDK